MTGRTAIQVISVVCMVLLFSAAASACSCAEPDPPDEALDDSDAVFSGEVVDITEQSRDENLVAFDVSETWDGPEEGTLSVSTHPDSATCGYPFEEGTAYLVYAYGSDDDLHVSLCSRTTELEDAEDDIAALGSGDDSGTAGSSGGDTPAGLERNVLVLLVLAVLSGGLFIGKRYRTVSSR